MQKFLRILVVILLFMMCLLIGAKLANISLEGDQSTVKQPGAQENLQHRLLVFVVDELNDNNPNLISVWSVIIYYQDAKGIMFIPLTDNTMEDFREYKRSFLLKENKFPQDKSLKFFNTKFKTRWDATIVLDDYAKKYLIGWLNQTSDINNTFENLEIDIVDQLCATLTSRQENSLESPDWNLIIPAHFSTDLTFENMQELWQKLGSSEEFLCEQIQY